MSDVLGAPAPSGRICGEMRKCPISKGTCPGECIYAEVMESQNLGVVVLDLARDSVVFLNRSSRELFKRLGHPSEFAALRGLLLSSEDEAALSGTDAPRSVRVGSRLLGYTVYRSGSFAWMLVRDITEKARLESIAEAVETMNNMGYVFAAVRHELGNPINSIKAALSVLRANLHGFQTDTVDEYLRRMEIEVARVETLLRSLKSFSMYERLQVETLEMEPFLKSFVSLAAGEASRRGLAVRLHVPAPCSAACDPRALQQVLLNLFANAVDALSDSPRPEIRLSASATDSLVTIRFVDNGAGMDEEQLKHLFKPFHTSKDQGTGLGLVIARKMLSRMGGTIAIDSARGAGTSVAITLPERPVQP